MIRFVSAFCFILIVGEVFQVQCEPSKFVKEDKHLYDVVNEQASQKYFATKRKINNNDFKVSGAEAKKVWMYIRHGTRSLKRFEIPILTGLESVAKQVVESFKNEKSVPFSKNAWDKLKTWKLDVSVDRSQSHGKVDMITSSGKTELESVAKNYQGRFPSLFTNKYSPDQFHLLHSTEERCKESMEVFFGKIFGKNAAEGINGTVEGTEYEGIVEAYRVYVDSVQPGQRPANVELPKFQQLPAYKTMVERIVKEFRLKVTDYNTKQKLVSNIFDMCRYEEAWYSNHSAWCSFFKADDIKMLQYGVDLYNFYEWGYGIDQNNKIQCPTIRDMVKSFEGGAAPVTAYFTHIPEVSLHLVAMHAYPEKQKLTADNYGAMSKRVWQSSKLVPFAANFAAVLYGNNQVKFFMNEELVQLSWCKKGVCNLSDLKKNFSQCF
ncbi:multiple inositol polyphosphate phosphatase 1-like [Contarinia nasturtii]|uniref:multiple inositol polyphosphate phosphatase 1-like n=1 Tax=Contarinia nasturtii TaxID=265458 RepID=UPI0012D38481|nr:multiple inositol polyphosphate phosphatase 1-like [Contarinia nasturtii]